VVQRFSWRARLRSFGHAFSGVATLLHEQHNSRLHLLAAIIVISLGVLLELSRGDWIALVLAIGLVWLAEALNSALEYLCDAVTPEQHPLIKKSKDVAAAGVLLAALLAVVVGLLVFLPYLNV